MNRVVAGLTGWGSAFLPSLAAAGLLAAAGHAPAEIARHDILAWGVGSAAVLGLLGTLLGLTRGSADETVADSAIAGAFMPGLLCVPALPVTLVASRPSLWILGLAVFFLPGPIAAAAAAWTRMRNAHGTS